MTPTASPLPPISANAQTLIDELRTTIIYASLIGSGGFPEGLCGDLDPAGFDNFTAYNGTVIRDEVCNTAFIQKFIPGVYSSVKLENQVAVSYLFTALFAVQVAGGFAGGTNLATLCSEIESDLIDNIFIGYVEGGGTAVKNYVCAAANKTTSLTAPYPTSTHANATAPTCTKPTSFANTVVPAPDALATTNFNIASPFIDAYQLFEIIDNNTALAEATIATFCLDQCITYQLATGKACLSFFVNIGKPDPPVPGFNADLWYCKGYSAPLSQDTYVPVDTTVSYRYGLGVNRVCEGTYRAY